jgi:hypothetical protein
LTLGHEQVLDHEPRPRIREAELVVKEGRRADDETIEPVAVVACERQALAASGRATIPVVPRRLQIVIVERENPGPLDLLMNAFDDVIDDLPAIELIRRLDDAERATRAVFAVVCPPSVDEPT